MASRVPRAGSMSNLRRRDVIGFAGAAAAAWPARGFAQQPKIPVIGFLSTRWAEESDAAAAAFRRGLTEAGYVEGQNVQIEYRWAENQYERLPSLAADL